MRTWATIDLEAIRRNARAMREYANDAPLIAVVKADAYGHGAIAVARALKGIAQRFAVATADEAQELRAAGVDEPILLLYPLLPDEIDAALDAKAEITLGSLGEARRLAEALDRRDETAMAHVKINTGMNRYGVACDETKALVDFCRASERLRLVGAWTHFACATSQTDPMTVEQYSRFARIVEEADLSESFLHIASSAVVLNFPAMALDGMRIGIGLYGAFPAPDLREVIRLEPALTWRARVNRVATLRRGESVSYGGLFTATDDMRIATLTVGYADGYPHAAVGKASVLLHGKRAPVLGAICMDALVCDVTRIPEVRYGDAAVLVGECNDDRITADQLAEWAGTIPYEVFTRIGPRVRRLYRSDRDQ